MAHIIEFRLTSHLIIERVMMFQQLLCLGGCYFITVHAIKDLKVIGLDIACQS